MPLSDGALAAGEKVDLRKLRSGLRESKKRKLKKNSGGHCIICGSDDGLEIAHILPLKFVKDAQAAAIFKKSLGRGDSLSKKFERDLPALSQYVNDERNLAVLCGRCHRKYDRRDGGGRPRQTKLTSAVLNRRQ